MAIGLTLLIAATQWQVNTAIFNRRITAFSRPDRNRDGPISVSEWAMGVHDRIVRCRLRLERRHQYDRGRWLRTWLISLCHSGDAAMGLAREQ